jgi:uncharacterized protein (DUF1697 family)
MKSYVLLLRGINVGGNNRVEMYRLRALLETMGFDRVESYINSGNVIFDTSKVPNVGDSAGHIEKEFGLKIPCILLPGDPIVRIANAIPDEWVNNSTDRKSDVLYLFKESDRPDILKEIGHNPDIESFRYEEGAIITTISRKHQSKGSLLKIIGTDLYKTMTIRNVTTARKLASIVLSRKTG